MHATLLAAAVLLSNFSKVPVQRVIDGDTFVVQIGGYEPVFGEQLPVRILGINTPERTDKRICARRDHEAARAELEAMIKGKQVELIGCQRDKYFRLGCLVQLEGGLDMGFHLMNRDLAVPYDGGTKPRWRCRR